MDCKTTLVPRIQNLKGEILEISKTEGEILMKNVIDVLRYWNDEEINAPWNVGSLGEGLNAPTEYEDYV